MIRFLLIILFFTSIVVWGAGLFIANDFSVLTKNVSSFKRVLVIFAHADDEILGAGGVMHQLSSQGAHVTYLLLTKGERGNKETKEDEALKILRAREAEEVSKILGVDTLIQKDMGDLQLEKKKGEVYGVVADAIYDEQPDLIITYDTSGLYGHTDHIAVSEVVTDLVKTRYNKTKLWYVTYPKNVLHMVKLPTRMAQDPEFVKQRKTPTHKVLIAASLPQKIQGVYAYETQHESIIEGFSVKQIPLWFYASLAPFEYFHEAN